MINNGIKIENKLIPPKLVILICIKKNLVVGVITNKEE